MAVARALLAVMFDCWSPLAPGRLVGQDDQLLGSGRVGAKSADHGISQGHASGDCNGMRRPEYAILAGTLTSFRRIAGVVTVATAGPVTVEAARVTGQCQ